MTTAPERPRTELVRFWSGVLARPAVPPPAWPAAGAVPGGTVPAGAVPGGTVPGGTAPGGAVRHDRGPDPELAAALAGLCRDTGATAGSVLLAAHAFVVATLTGEPEVLTGLVSGGRLLPCRVQVADGTWAELLDRARRAEAAVLVHRDTAPAAPPVPTAVGTGTGAPPDGPSWTLGADAGTGRLVLDHDPARADAAHAARIAGYHATALALLARHGRSGDRTVPRGASLPGPAEREHQIHGLGGPRRELPDRRVHELIEERVRRHPDRVAVTCGARGWTYAELDRAANRIAHTLIAEGVCTEDVVAVVTRRDLEWAASVLAVFKAGATYLPIEPDFPRGRIDWMLDRARVRAVVCESRTADALPAGERPVLVADEIVGGPAPDRAPDVPVGAGQAAYIYFTSGSTGEPKGAVCEHGGLLNHVLAKIEDLGVDEDGPVAQTAPQCFDISLWQLVSAWVVGGRTVVVDQDTVLDVARLADVLDEQRVAVLQLVPSYLELLLTHLERHPRELPGLRCVSATGEALGPALADRWFAARPGTTLVNAYGLTETCDDTNHETLVAAPGADRVPLGRPINNVAVYVVDDDLQPVPLGSVGEIVFSGVCVARGYVNDPERTRRAFLPDPHRPGARLYRSGDHGRWLPDGKLEFHGRRDAQVKIRGFRIELGEVENALLRAGGVREGAVVVTGPSGGEPSLAAFCTGARDADAVRAELADALPGYMVPAAVHVLDTLPVTANGKIDRAALAARATPAGRAREPESGAERRLAAVWARVLGRPAAEIGRDTDFFDAGGTSLSALRLVLALDRAVSLSEVRAAPVLADLAALLGTRSWTPLPG